MASKVKMFSSISRALASLDYGETFSTTDSKRVYVVTKAGWGRKSKGSIAKGFPEGTDDKIIQGYASRTKSKHGGSNVKFEDYIP